MSLMRGAGTLSPLARALALRPAKTQAGLVFHAGSLLAGTIIQQGLQSIAGRRMQELQRLRCIKLCQLSSCVGSARRMNLGTGSRRSRYFRMRAERCWQLAYRRQVRLTNGLDVSKPNIHVHNRGTVSGGNRLDLQVRLGAYQLAQFLETIISRVEGWVRFCDE
jgi:hypothetical protein